MVQKNSLNFKPVVVIGGATATGKSGLAVLLAKKFNGEIISADSMQIYKGFDVGTAKIPKKEMGGITHHLIDIASGNDSYSVGKFKQDAEEKIDEILNKGKIPIVVGGTGLYLNSIVFNYEFGGKGETKKQAPKYDFICFVAEKPREEMYNKINKRVDLMIKNGLLDEIKNLLNKGFTFESCAFRAIGYKEFKNYFNGVESLDVCIEELKKNTRHYAKRQVTWFKQWKDFAHFVDASSFNEIAEKVERFLYGKN